MKITVYTLVTDDKNGTEVDVFATNEQAEQAAIAYVESDWADLLPDTEMPASFNEVLDRLMDEGFNELVRIERHDLELPRRWYVVMTWDNWPEGGSYGTIVNATSHDDAEAQCRQEMAETRAGEYEGSADEVRRTWGDDWHTVDCFPLDEFASHLMKKVFEQ